MQPNQDSYTKSDDYPELYCNVETIAEVEFGADVKRNDNMNDKTSNFAVVTKQVPYGI